MPIDDIHYLYKNSSKENIVLLIDSRKRDKKTYRTPSEFVIEFPEPFKNVVGVEVLNAAIPRTTFTVDEHNNFLKMWSYEYSIDDDNNQITTNEFRNKIVTPNDFNAADKLLSALTTLFREKDETFNVEANSLALESDADIATKGFLKLESTFSPFIMDNRESISPLSPILGFNLFANESDGTYNTLSYLKTAKQMLYPLSPGEISINRKNTISHEHTTTIKASEIVVESDERSVVDVQLPLVFNCPLLIDEVKINDVSYDLSILDSKFCFDGKLQLVMAETTNEDLVIATAYTSLMPGGKYMSQLDYDNTFASRITNYNFEDEDPVSVVIDSSTEGDDDTCVRFVNEGTVRLSLFLNQFKIKVEKISDVSTEQKIFVYFHSTHSTKKHDFLLEVDYLKEGDDHYIAFDASKYMMRNLNPMNFMRIFNAEYQAFYMTDENTASAQRIRLIEALKNDETSSETVNSVLYNIEFKIVPPGIINMVTENYLILRCPEIENHSRGSYDANGDVSPGLALFTIDVKSGYAGNKNEFFSVKYKEFHPIGKLARLHFRFERKSDRQLYDFKGIDLHFMLSIKMLAAVKLNDRELEYSLNPNYNPDYQGFMNTSFAHVESDEEADEGKIKRSDFDTEIELQNIAQQRRVELQYGSSDEEYDTSSSDEEI